MKTVKDRQHAERSQTMSRGALTKNVATRCEVDEGKCATFAEIAVRRRAQLLWLAQQMTQNREEAEDVLQEALLKAYRNLGNFRGDSQMGTWIAVIVKNTGREWLRRQKRRTNIPLEEFRSQQEEPQMMEFADPAESPERGCARKEMTGMMFTEIDALDSVCKSALEMCMLEELSHMEAARMLGVNVFTIKSRIFHGKRMLKRAIARRLNGAPEEKQAAAG